MAQLLTLSSRIWSGSSTDKGPWSNASMLTGLSDFQLNLQGTSAKEFGTND
jgi:hypothetical protein